MSIIEGKHIKIWYSVVLTKIARPLRSIGPPHCIIVLGKPFCRRTWQICIHIYVFFPRSMFVFPSALVPFHGVETYGLFLDVSFQHVVGSFLKLQEFSDLVHSWLLSAWTCLVSLGILWSHCPILFIEPAKTTKWPRSLQWIFMLIIHCSSYICLLTVQLIKFCSQKSVLSFGFHELLLQRVDSFVFFKQEALHFDLYCALVDNSASILLA